MALTGIDANRREIATGVCDVVAQVGLENLTMRRIASHLGSTTGYISHYFADKEDLLEGALRAALEDVTTETGPLSRNLDEWIENSVASLPSTERTRRFWLVLTAFQGASLHSPRLAEVLRVYVSEQEKALAAHLAAALGEPAHGHDDNDDENDDDAGPVSAELTALARSTFALVSGLGTTSILNPDAFTTDQQRAVVAAGIQSLLEEYRTRRAAARED